MAKITLRKIFSEHFAPMLLNNGFKRFKNGFVRMHGDGMLQAIMLFTSGPAFEIRYACFPYWIFELRRVYTRGLNSSIWMEEYQISRYQNDEAPQYGRYFEDNPEEAVEDMKAWSKYTENCLLPMLDRVKNIDDYLKYICWTVDEPRPGRRAANQYVLLYKSYLENSFAYAEKYIDDYEGYVIWLNPDVKDINERMKDVRERILPSDFDVLMEKIEENDLAWIVGFREEKCAEMRKAIHDVLKIDVSE